MSVACKHILTILAVRDLSTAVEFYDRAFGWQKSVDVPVFVEYELPGGQRLGVYERQSFALNTGVIPNIGVPGEITATELYFHCDELDEAIARIRKAGARELAAKARKDWGDEAAYFADPDGNVLVLARTAAK